MKLKSTTDLNTAENFPERAINRCIIIDLKKNTEKLKRLLYLQYKTIFSNSDHYSSNRALLGLFLYIDSDKEKSIKYMFSVKISASSLVE